MYIYIYIYVLYMYIYVYIYIYIYMYVCHRPGSGGSSGLRRDPFFDGFQAGSGQTGSSQKCRNCP